MNLTIKNKLILMIISILLFIIIIIGSVFVFQRNRVYDYTRELSAKETELHAEKVGHKFDLVIVFLGGIANHHEAKNQNINYVMSELKNFELIYPDRFISVSYISKEGMITTTQGDEADVSDRAYFQDLQDRSKQIHLVGPMIGRVTNMPLIGIGTPIFNDSEEFMGAVSVSIELSRLTEIIDNIEFNENGYAWIVNEFGEIITHPEEKYLGMSIFELEEEGIESFKDIANEMIISDFGDGRYYDSNLNAKKILTYHVIPNTPGWRLGITSFEKDIFSDASRYILITTIYIVVFFAVLLILIISIFGSITNPILNLTRIINNYKENSEELLAIPIRKDEIGALTSAYQDMTLELFDYTHLLEDLVDLRTSELDEKNEILNKLNNDLIERNTELYEDASIDSLTGVVNRRQLINKLEALINSIQKGALDSFTLLFLDLNNFKYYNDTFGHDIGDELLKYSSYLLKKNTRDTDIVARYGGDEFIILIQNLNIEQAESFKTKIKMCYKKLNGAQALVAEWTKKNNKDIIIPEDQQLGASIGYHRVDQENSKDINEIIKAADDNMYDDKKKK